MTFLRRMRKIWQQRRHRRHELANERFKCFMLAFLHCVRNTVEELEFQRDFVPDEDYARLDESSSEEDL